MPEAGGEDREPLAESTGGAVSTLAENGVGLGGRARAPAAKQRGATAVSQRLTDRPPQHSSRCPCTRFGVGGMRAVRSVRFVVGCLATVAVYGGGWLGRREARGSAPQCPSRNAKVAIVCKAMSAASQTLTHLKVISAAGPSGGRTSQSRLQMGDKGTSEGEKRASGPRGCRMSEITTSSPATVCGEAGGQMCCWFVCLLLPPPPLLPRRRRRRRRRRCKPYVKLLCVGGVCVGVRVRAIA